MSLGGSSFQYLLHELADEHENEVKRLRDEKEDLQKNLEEVKAQFVELKKQFNGGYGDPWPMQGAPSVSMTETMDTEPSMVAAMRRTPSPAAACSRGLHYYLEQLMSSPRFEATVAVFVTASAIVSALEMQYYGLKAGYHIGYHDIHILVSKYIVGAEDFFHVADVAFTTLFTIELSLRLWVFRVTFFMTALNWLDVIAVTVGLTNLLLEDILGQASVGQASVVRLMRLLKLARGLRLVKLTRVLESLHFLLQSMRASVATLFWSLCVLMIIQCIAGMMLSQLVQDFISGAGLEGELTEDQLGPRRAVFAYYGTFTRTMITMFEIHLANWAPACRVLVDNIGEAYGFAFVAYRCLAGFAVLNVINAVFIQQTLKVAQQDQHVMIMQKEKAQEQNRRNILGLFKELDKSGDGLLSKDEFNALLTDKRLKTWLSCLEIDLTDVSHLFKVLERGGGDINATEFMMRLSSIKGPAKSIDMAELLARTARIETKLNRFASDSGEVQEDELSNCSTPRCKRNLEEPVSTSSSVKTQNSQRRRSDDSTEPRGPTLLLQESPSQERSERSPCSTASRRKLEELAGSLRETAAPAPEEYDGPQCPGTGHSSLGTYQITPWCIAWPGCLRALA